MSSAGSNDQLNPVDPATLTPGDLADALHDGAIQDISVVVMRLESFERRHRLEPVSTLEELASIREQARQALRRLRSLCARLREDHDRRYQE